MLEVHLIGHLQSNKVRKAIQLYDVIQTIDSIKLAKKISTIANKSGKIQRIYIQVNTGKDPLKKGFLLKDVNRAAFEIAQLDNILLEGVMMIAPFADIDGAYRKIYTKTRDLRDQLLFGGIDTCKYLSMGMSRDYEMAIEEGATHIRVGSALFGNR